MKNFLLEQQQKAEKIAILTQFIQSNPEARELKRAMALQGEPYSKITNLFDMHLFEHLYLGRMWDKY